MTNDVSIYSKPEILLGDLRGGICSSGLCRQLRAVAADEIERLGSALAYAQNCDQRQVDEIERLRSERDTAREALRISESYVRELSDFRVEGARLRALVAYLCERHHGAGVCGMGTHEAHSNPCTPENCSTMRGFAGHADEP